MNGVTRFFDIITGRDIPVSTTNPLPTTGGGATGAGTAAAAARVTYASDGATIPVRTLGVEYEAVAASQMTQSLGATGAAGDLLEGLLVIPATTSPGAISIKDGSNTAITIFTGGASSINSLIPFYIPLGLQSLVGAWQVTTGASVSVLAGGNFT